MIQVLFIICYILWNVSVTSTTLHGQLVQDKNRIQDDCEGICDNKPRFIVLEDINRSGYYYPRRVDSNTSLLEYNIFFKHPNRTALCVNKTDGYVNCNGFEEYIVMEDNKLRQIFTKHTHQIYHMESDKDVEIDRFDPALVSKFELLWDLAPESSTLQTITTPNIQNDNDSGKLLKWLLCVTFFIVLLFSIICAVLFRKKNIRAEPSADNGPSENDRMCEDV